MKTLHTKDKNAVNAFDGLPPVEEGEQRVRIERVSPKGEKSYALMYDEQHTLDIPK